MEREIEAAVESRQIPGVALLAADKTGKLNYARCFGRRGIDEHEKPLQLDTVLRFASASKLITSVACMQCVEQGLLELDSDISHHLPELRDLKVLSGFVSQRPQLREPDKAITLRHLLSHSSGFCYDAMHPLLIQYREWQGVKIQPDYETVAERFLYPLVYDPGTSWSYGPSLEWAGKAVEQATGTTLNSYVQKYICKPLGIKDLSFKLQQERPDMLARRATTCDRHKDGTLHAGDNEFWHKDYADDFGGMGIFTTPSDFFEVLRSLLLNDGKLLRPHTLELMVTPQLGPNAVDGLNRIFSVPELQQVLSHLVPANVGKSHSLAGLLMREDAPGGGWRRKGTVVWGGAPNIIWFVDREAGICGLYASQVRPPGDPTSYALAELFEREMYGRVHGES